MIKNTIIRTMYHENPRVLCNIQTTRPRGIILVTNHTVMVSIPNCIYTAFLSVSLFLQYRLYTLYCIMLVVIGILLSA